METASKDVLFTIALNLKLPDLLRWCSSNSKINRDVCNNDNVWRSKLLKDYPDIEIFQLNKSLREIYVFLYQLTYIKELLNSNGSIHNIFQRKVLNLSQKGLKKVLAFDLPNLQDLFLYKNKLTSVPIFNLPNLRHLDLHGNQLVKVPDFNLPNLEILDLYNNQLTEVPAFHLPKLQLLTLYSNSLDKSTKKEVKEKYQNKVVL